jgi:hypothetical protein
MYDINNCCHTPGLFDATSFPAKMDQNQEVVIEGVDPGATVMRTLHQQLVEPLLAGGM